MSQHELFEMLTKIGYKQAGLRTVSCMVNASFTITSLLLTLGSFLVTFSLGGWKPCKSMRGQVVFTLHHHI